MRAKATAGRFWLLQLGLALAWIFLWHLGRVPEQTANASLWFPAAGLTFAAFLAIGRRAAIAVMVAAVVVTFQSAGIHGDPRGLSELLVSGIAFGVAHTLAYGLGAALFGRVYGDSRLGTSRGVVGFLLLSALSALLAAVSGLWSLAATGTPKADLSENLIPWWIGDLVGVRPSGRCSCWRSKRHAAGSGSPGPASSPSAFAKRSSVPTGAIASARGASRRASVSPAPRRPTRRSRRRWTGPTAPCTRPSGPAATVSVEVGVGWTGKVALPGLPETSRVAAGLTAFRPVLHSLVVRKTFVSLSYGRHAASVTLCLAAAASAWAETPLQREIDRRAEAITPQVVAWRRDIHQHPELGNREVRTAGLVAEHLRRLGFEVRTGVAHTGVVGVLRGGKPGRVVALRADMDALPVTEELDLPFASKVRASWNGQETGVMHACGHDTHVAMLMGAAEVLAGLRDELPGTVKVIFQPAEEGAPPGEEGGAELMIREGVLESPRPDAVFGLHVFPGKLGTIIYRPGPTMASQDTLKIVIHGRQTHGAMPWKGVDPIVAAAQVVVGLQTIVSRQVDITAAPAVVSIGRIQGGNRSNIIPEQVELEGTIRAFDEAARADIHRRVRETAAGIAMAAGASATVSIERGYPVTVNDPELTRRMAPTLERVVGAGNLGVIPPMTVAEDFSFYGRVVPAMYFFLCVTPPELDPATAPPNHSPRFSPDERALPVGVKALASLAVDFLTAGPSMR